MNKFKVIIVDDEKEAREGVKVLLKDDSSIDIAALCENGVKAIEAIEKLNPDILFLDIQMPGIDGIEVLNSISEDKMPAVIFTTAFDQYALKAFDLHAVDYLLKPFTNERFYEALEHAKALLIAKKNTSTEIFSLIEKFKKEIYTNKDNSLVDERASEDVVFKERLIVKADGKIYFLQFEDIIWFEADDYFVKVHTTKKKFMVRESLKNLEKRLPGNIFVRIHRSKMINKTKLEVIEPYFNGDFFVTLSEGTKIRGSRNYKNNLNI